MLIDFRTLISKYNFTPKGILHIGGHTGQEAEVYNQICQGDVVWIEANPQLYKRLLRHLEQYPRQIGIHALVSDTDGVKMDFNISSNDGQSSSILELGTHAVVHPEVTYVDKIELTTSRVDMIDYDFSGLDFLNIDLQGAELLALKGMGDLLDQFNFAYLEFNRNELYKGCPLLPELIDFMKVKGFVFRELKDSGSHGWGDLFMTREYNRLKNDS